MTVTVATAIAHRDAWLAANLAIAKGKSYSIGDRTLTRQDADEVRRELSYWQGVVNTLTAEAAGSSNASVKIAKWS